MRSFLITLTKSFGIHQLLRDTYVLTTRQLAKVPRTWKLSKKKWLNYSARLSLIGNSAKHQVTYLFHTSIRKSAFPQTLFIEDVNICNSDCIFCSYRYDKRPKKILSEDLLKKTINEFYDMGGENIGLTPMQGELFVDKDILQKIHYIASKKFSSIHTFSNATLFHKFGVEKILTSGLTEIHISVSPLDEEIYKRVYRNPNYKTVLRNTRDLLIAFKTIPNRTIQKIQIEFRSDRPLAECRQLPDFKNEIEPHLSEGVTIGVIQDFDSWSGAILKEDLIEGMRLNDGQKLGSKFLPCNRIFNAQVVGDGKIRLCGCRIDTGAKVDELEIGDLNKMSLMEAYNSPKARDIITSFSRGDLLNICKNCSWYRIG